MNSITIIQSRKRPDVLALEQKQYRTALLGAGEVNFVSSLDESLSWADPTLLLSNTRAVIIGGSGEFDFDGGRTDDDPARTTSHAILDRLTPIIQYVKEQKIPMLGICYGHQLVGEVYGARVVHDLTQNKVGTFAVELTKEGCEDPLFAELPREFLAQYGHKDSLSSLPAGATVLAVGERCRFSALRYGPLFYTLQFHPELTAQDSIEKLANSPGYLPEGGMPEDLIRESPEASTLIPRFLSLIP